MKQINFIIFIFLKTFVLCINSENSLKKIKNNPKEYLNQTKKAEKSNFLNKVKKSNITEKTQKNFFENETKDLKSLSKAFTTIFLSGLFDKSFFITALMAMKFSNIIVICSATSSLSLIGIISVFLGLTINKYIPAIYIDIFSIVLFLFFGASMIYDGMQIKENENTENVDEEIKEKLQKEKNKTFIKDNENICKCDSENNNLITNDKDKKYFTYCKICETKNDIIITDITKLNTSNNMNNDNLNSACETKADTKDLDLENSNNNNNETSSEFLVNFQAFSKTFFLIFFGEIGDRSQISTIYLTANFDKFIVMIAVISSSFILTLCAVYGGILISNKISEKKLTIFAGFIFILFAVFAIIFIDTEDLITLKKNDFAIKKANETNSFLNMKKENNTFI